MTYERRESGLVVPREPKPKKRCGIVTPLAVGAEHESMAKIMNADGVCIGRLEGDRFNGTPSAGDVARVLVRAYNRCRCVCDTVAKDAVRQLDKDRDRAAYHKRQES